MRGRVSPPILRFPMDPAHSPLIHCVADAVCRELGPGPGPLSVLDVGSGQGALLAVLAGRGWPGAGLEQHPTVTLRSAAKLALSGSADHLPFADRCIPVVVLRHVPHHLADPAACFAEARRVAGRRLVLAEPYFDPSLPGQRAGQEADRRLKALDRLRGEFHADSLGARELLDLVDPGAGAVRIESHLPLVPWQEADLRQRLAAAKGALRLEAKEKSAWDELLLQARDGRVSRNGTLILSIDWP